MTSETPTPIPTPMVVRLRNVAKTYRVYARPIDRLWELVRPGHRRSKDFPALTNIDLDVARGQALGIIGRNGSGKSTLLRIICGITQPTRGTVEVTGRIAPLLALGAGFNPEFTGRENVRICGAILGLAPREIEERFDSIASFADIGDAIEQPIRTYSSGMYARLAFAVAVSIDPEILVVDETLSVGDVLFARKCFARIEEMRRKGVTILFVSHSVATVLELCDRAVLLHEGRLVADGAPREVMRRYHALLSAGTTDVQAAQLAPVLAPVTDNEEPADDGTFDAALVPPDPTELPPNGARIQNLRFVNARGQSRNRVRLGAHYQLEYEVVFDKDAVGVTFGFHFRTTTGVRLGGAFAPRVAGQMDVRAGDVVRVSFPIRMRLLQGNYFVQVSVRSLDDASFMHRLLDVLMISVEPAPTAARGIVSLLAGEPTIDHVPSSLPVSAERA